MAAHYASSFSSAEEMRKGLLTAAAMDRVKELDGQLEDKLAEVGGEGGRGPRGRGGEGARGGGEDG